MTLTLTCLEVDPASFVAVTVYVPLSSDVSFGTTTVTLSLLRVTVALSSTLLSLATVIFGAG